MTLERGWASKLVKEWVSRVLARDWNKVAMVVGARWEKRGSRQREEVTGTLN